VTQPPSPLTTALADRYRIERELGAGGMATVYLAQDLKHHRPVALKVLRPELAAILGAERFLKEIEVTANLQHPNILPLYDSGEAGTFLFYVMPYVEGDTLRDRLTREHQLPVDDALEIAKGMAAALQYAHEHKIIHRDIKPGNVLLQGGQAVVADFGIALAVSHAGGRRLTETGLSLGTPHYMSPEQATGDRVLDARSDIYSLGAVVYEMLAGDPPHTGSSAQSVLAKVLTEEPTPLSKVRTMLPANVDAAVQRALAKAPADRFKSAAAFAAALVNPSYSIPATAFHASTARGRMLGGWRLGAALIGAAAIGLLAGQWIRGDDGKSLQVVEFSLPVRLGDVDFGPALDISADGTQIVFIGRDAEDRPGLYRRGLADRAPVPIAGTSGFIMRSPSVSPDGRRVAYSSQSQLRVTSLMGGGGTRTLADVSPTSGGISWGENDDIVYQPGFGSGLMVVNAVGSKARKLTTVDSAARVDHRWPQVLPGGKWVIATLWTGQPRSAQIARISLKTGEVHELLAGAFARYSSDNLYFVGPDRSLQVVAFDAGSGELRGQPVSVADSVEFGGDGAAQFAISQTGTFAYFRSLGRRVPVIVDRTGAVTPIRVEPAMYQSPRISPDGRAMALEVAGGDIWIYNFVSSTFSRLTDGGGFYSVWSPDSRRILYSRDEAADVNIYSVPVDRSAPPKVVVGDPGQQRTQDLSPDGRNLMIRQNVGPGQYDLFVLAVDSSGAKPKSWLVTPFLDRAPVFSHDGKWVAYTSDESGRDEVYVRPFPGPGGRIQVSSGGGTEPSWSANGGELYYRISGEVLKVGVEMRPMFRVISAPLRLVPGVYYRYPWQRQYDVHPDGRRFVFLRNEAEIDDLMVTVNWTQQIRAATGR